MGAGTANSINPQRIVPGPGQESVWDYPRPPRVEESARHIQVVFNGVVIADTRRARRVLETSHPPVYYIPAEDIRMEYLLPSPHRTWCEWKGQVAYYHVQAADKRAENAAWTYPRPDGCMHGRRRAGAGPARRLLRRLDHRQHRRPVQGRARHRWLVDSASACRLGSNIVCHGSSARHTSPAARRTILQESQCRSALLARKSERDPLPILSCARPDGVI